MNLPLMNLRRYETSLRREGYHKIGEGAFGKVFAKPNSKYVIKTGGLASNDGYLAFVEAVQKANSPYFPKFVSVKKYERFFVIKMERLLALHACTDKQADAFHKQARAFGVGGVFDVADILNLSAKKISKLKKDRQLVIKVIKRLCTIHCEDLHFNNVMLRVEGKSKYRMVITDPVT